MAAKGKKIAWVRLRSETTRQWFAHPDLRDRMIADAEEKGTNLTDLANRILCDRFNVAYSPNPRKSKPSSDPDILNFGISPELKRVITMNYDPWQDGVRLVLCSHYGLRVPAKVKQTRKRNPKPVAA